MNAARALALVLCLPVVGTASDFYVPDDFPSIQAAISDPGVGAGDTIIVRPGTYPENIDFNGKAITLKSEKGAWLTTIAGVAPPGSVLGSVVTFWSGEGRDSVLDGFTITQGYGNLINTYQHCGGGIFCGGASSPTIINNVVTGNLVDAFGGGLYCEASSNPDVVHNSFIENWSDDDGAGIASWYSSPNIASNLIRFNNTQAEAGGIDLWGSQATIVNNVITANNAGATGFNASGGGIRCVDGSTPTITSNTICENFATWDGGGVYSISGSLPVITNSIIWDNMALHASPSISGAAIVTYSDVQMPTGVFPGIGNINANPLFVNQAIGDCHLTALSPCIDAGDNAAPALPDLDFEGDPRRADVPGVPDTGNGAAPMVDMGADEFHRHLYYTGLSVTGGAVQVNFVGLPGTRPVTLVLGFSTYDPPLSTSAGDWYVKPPMIFLPLPAIPASGVLTLPGTIPTSPPGPYTLCMQAVIGSTLTNLCLMNVL